MHKVFVLYFFLQIKQLYHTRVYKSDSLCVTTHNVVTNLITAGVNEIWIIYTELICMMIYDGREFRSKKWWISLCNAERNVKHWNNGWFSRHLEFGLVDTSGMSDQQRREIPYTVVQSQSSVQQCTLQSSNSRLDDADSSSLPRYDDLKAACDIHNHPPQLEDETGSVVIV